MEKIKLKLDKRAILAVVMCTTFAFGAPLGVMAEKERDEAEKNKDFLLDGVVVTATRTETEQFRANANISVITARDIENNHWRDLSEALRSVPGVDIRDYGSAGHQNSITLYINGSNAVVVLIDGVKVNMSDAKFSPSMLANLDNIERIEVLKGSASTLYGSDAKGGVINIITKKVDGMKTTFKVGIGGFDAENYSFSHEGRQAGWAWRIQYQKDFAGDFKDGNGITHPSYLNADTTSFLLKREFGKKSDLTLTYDSYKTNSNSYWDLWDSRPAKVDIDNYGTKLIYNIRLNDKTTNQLSYLNSMYNTYYDGWFWGMPSTNRLKIETNRISEQFTRRINDAHTLTAGFEYTHEKINADSSTAIYNKTINNTSLYIQDEWNITKQWKLTGGARYDNNSVFGSHTTPSINLGYEFTPKTNMYIGYSEYFLAPTPYDLYSNYGDPNLKPETGNTSEIGINHRVDDTFVVSAHLFKRNSKDKLGYDPNTFVSANVGDEKANGWDIQLKKQFTKSINAYLGYTHTNIDPTINTSTRNTDGYVPRGVWNIGVDYSKNKLNISLLGRGVIDRPGPKNPTPSLPESNYWIWDIGINYQTSACAKVFLKINNLFDKYYAEQTNVWSGGGAGEWWAMPGRNIYAGMQYSF